MKNTYFYIALFFALSIQAQIQLSYGDLQDGTNGITAGYGSVGNHLIIKETVINDVANDGEITFYHPDIAQTPLPTIFFISGWGRGASTYEKFFHFLASQGYAVVSIYNNTPGNISQSYQFSLNMILATAQNHYPNWLDTSRVSLMGHSYGAGATLWLGKELFNNATNWGTNGRCIFMTAPWYSLLVTENDLINYPNDVKLLIEVNDDDISNGQNGSTWNTDERAIRAAYQLINIPNSEKDFVRTFSNPATFQYDKDNDGVTETYTYTADHYLSYSEATTNGVYKTWDAMDVFTINRLAHALLDYTFNANQTAKNIALGNGSMAQVAMDFLTDLYVTDSPIITRAENDYAYKCTANWNDFENGANTWFLQNACLDVNNDGIIDVINLAVNNELSTTFNLYPIPTSNQLTIRLTNETETINTISIITIMGKTVYEINKPITYKIDTSSLMTGTYFVKVQTEKGVGVSTFIKK